MHLSADVLASSFLAVACAALLVAHRGFGDSRRYRRVAQQGATFIVGFNFMHAGFWMLQPLVRFCARSGISPSTVTWCSLLPALAASILAGTGHWGFAAWSLLVAGMLDVVDGAVARATGEVSDAGAVLDSLLDRYAEGIFFAGLFVHYRYSLAAQMVIFAATLGSFLISYSSAKAEALRLTPPRGTMRRSDRLTLLVLGSAFTPVFAVLDPPRAAQAWPMLIGVSLIALLANASAIQRFRALARSARRDADPDLAARDRKHSGGRTPAPSPGRGALSPVANMAMPGPAVGATEATAAPRPSP